MSVQDRAEGAGEPDFYLWGAAFLEAVGRAPDVLGDVYEVEQNPHLDLPPIGFTLDQVELVAGAVEDDERLRPDRRHRLVQGRAEGGQGLDGFT
ncbi:hypothetical protein HLK59_09820 [Streptomyces sp. S3(2020)]|uniref:hypothetical protein n=1 Tax=Streptomyces sp. S3(2020) TaxID=2732044 RepID=UPI0014876CA5|nr:hypothetical protein [Streptomyces sp. S3(2020)]NNN30657.1 hypothetical protein [Streptomyces sp. S3(2020)]